MYPFLWNLTTHVVMRPTSPKITQNCLQNLLWLYFRLNFRSIFGYFWSFFGQVISEVTLIWDIPFEIFWPLKRTMVISSLEERRTWKASVFNTLKPFTGSKFCRKRSSREQFTCGELKIQIIYFQNVNIFFLKFDMRIYLDDVGSKTLLLASRRSMVRFLA